MQEVPGSCESESACEGEHQKCTMTPRSDASSVAMVMLMMTMRMTMTAMRITTLNMMRMMTMNMAKIASDGDCERLIVNDDSEVPQISFSCVIHLQGKHSKKKRGQLFETFSIQLRDSELGIILSI